MLNFIPVSGWILDLFLKMSLAAPFWFIWTVWGLGEKYFYFLPKVYHGPGFWDCVGVFMVVPILRLIFVPQIVSVTQKNTNNESNEKKEPEKK